MYYINTKNATSFIGLKFKAFKRFALKAFLPTNFADMSEQSALIGWQFKLRAAVTGLQVQSF